MAGGITIKGPVKNAMMRDIAKELKTIAWKVALKAYKSARFKNQSYNLHDSYGSAVFINGILVEGSIKYVERSRSKRVDRHSHSITGARTGREALERLFRTPWIVRKKDSITVVVAAAMWYAQHVDKKGLNVIDQAQIKSDISYEINRNPELLNMMKKQYGIDAPTVRRWLGIDEVYYYNR